MKTSHTQLFYPIVGIGFFFMFLVLSACQSGSSMSNETDIGAFDGAADIGEPGQPGTTVYDSIKQIYTLTGSGDNIWFDKDQFHFAWKEMSGDFILRARVRFEGEGINEHRKIGLMLRDDLSADSRHISAVVHGDGLAALQLRPEQGKNTREIRSIDVAPDVIQIERQGDRFIMSTAVYGQEFTRVKTDTINLNDQIYAGLFISSHDDNVTEKATFSNVRFAILPEEGFEAYRDYLGSHIEIMDVETGHRRVVHTSPLSLQAPNWTVDGEKLIYNSEGMLYTFDIATSQTAELPTGFATSNNNDHVLSFDGSWLGISHHAADHNNRSNIYVVPATGGTPERITTSGPSYLHGWSPNSEFLVFTGGRNNAEHLDVYKISRITKEEMQLTFSESLDDGPEYTPDGEFIYFNSARTGTMQIWRMRPDGSNQEQLTFDELNDWFPHISPDGKSMVFLSFLPEVDAGDHPFYKQVYLRSMPIEGGELKVTAYIFGGQGTINVPSWSPDGRQIAFVSNSIIQP